MKRVLWVFAFAFAMLCGCASPTGPGIVGCPVVNESFTPVLRRCVDPQTGAICYTRGEALSCVRVTP